MLEAAWKTHLQAQLWAKKCSVCQFKCLTSIRNFISEKVFNRKEDKSRFEMCSYRISWNAAGSGFTLGEKVSKRFRMKNLLLMSKTWIISVDYQGRIYPDGFEEVQVVQKVLLGVVEPGGRSLADLFLNHRRHLFVRDRHKFLQALLAPLPGTHVPQVDPEPPEEDLRQKQRPKRDFFIFRFRFI